MPKQEVKKIRKDLICIENVRVQIQPYRFKGKKYFRSVVEIPNFIDAGIYDMILVPKAFSTFPKEK